MGLRLELYTFYFWIPLLVVFSDFDKGFESERHLRDFSKYSKIILGLVFSIALASLFHRYIYDEDANSLLSNIRKLFYPVHSLLALSFFAIYTKIRELNF